jgi:hypothetical protein
MMAIGVAGVLFIASKERLESGSCARSSFAWTVDNSPPHSNSTVWACPERGSRRRTPHGLSGCLGQRNFASGPLVFAVKGLVHVRCLHGQEDGIRHAGNFQILVMGRYLIVMLLGGLM